MNERDSDRGKSRRPRGKPRIPRSGPEQRSPSPGQKRELGGGDGGARRPVEEKLAKISGQAAVAALFRQDPGRAVRLYYSEAMKMAAGPFCAKMAEMRRIYRLVTDEDLARVSGTVHHGGIVAAARMRPIHTLGIDAVARWARSGEPLVVLDGVSNPHNLGAIARSLAYFGVPRVLISGHQAQANLSDAAYRVAEGGLEYLEIFETPHLHQALKAIAEFFRVIGTTLRGGHPFGALPHDPRPICLVLGNEEEGLPPATLRACHAQVTIPGCGAIQSLNVSATAAILISRIMAESDRAKRPVPDRARPARPRRLRKR